MMTRGGRIAAIAAVFALLAGCASIPLSTLWRLHNLDASDLAQIQARDVRLAGLIDPAPLTIDAAHSSLLLILPADDRGKRARYRFGLRETKVYDSRLIPDSSPRWQAFELDAAGLAVWAKLRPRFLELRQNYGRVDFYFSFQLKGKPPKGADMLIASARLQLEKAQAPLVLLDRKRIHFDPAIIKR